MPMTAEEARQHWIRMTGKLAKVLEGSFEGSKPINPSYWKERLDEKHRPTIELNGLLAAFKKENIKTDFFEWVKDQKARQQVAYLNEEARAHYEIKFTGKRVIFTDMVRSVAPELETGKQELIFVLAAQQVFYGGVKSVGTFHHSSFLSGAPVAGAGTLMLKDGEVMVVADHSGHYTPGVKEMVAVLKAMSLQGADLGAMNVSIRVDNNEVVTNALDFVVAHSSDGSSSSASSPGLMVATPRVHAEVAAASSSSSGAASAAAAVAGPAEPETTSSVTTESGPLS